MAATITGNPVLMLAGVAAIIVSVQIIAKGALEKIINFIKFGILQQKRIVFKTVPTKAYVRIVLFKQHEIDLSLKIPEIIFDQKPTQEDCKTAIDAVLKNWLTQETIVDWVLSDENKKEESDECI